MGTIPTSTAMIFPTTGPKSQLQNLPEELLSIIFQYLSLQDLRQINLVHKRFYRHALPLLWNSIELTDCGPFQTSFLIIPHDHLDREEILDDHDDTPMLQKLVLLAK